MKNKKREIVSSALEKLSDDLVLSISENNFFVTGIGDEGESYVIVDFTKKMPETYKEFEQESINLYEIFANIEYWYTC